MEASPLTRVPKPSVFQPKIVSLYERLFEAPTATSSTAASAPYENDPFYHHHHERVGADEDDDILDSGFWIEFFLLRPESASLARILEAVDAEQLLRRHRRTQQLFAQCVAVLARERSQQTPPLPSSPTPSANVPARMTLPRRSSSLKNSTAKPLPPKPSAATLSPTPRSSSAAARPSSPSQGPSAVVHALQTLHVFFTFALPKKYLHPSSDIITLLSTLDTVDARLSEFVELLDWLIRSHPDANVRQLAVTVLLSFTVGAYQTSLLLTFLIQRDLFPSIIRWIQDAPTPPQCATAFLWLGLITNYNKFEFRNPYNLRLRDFVNDKILQKTAVSLRDTFVGLRYPYIAIQDDAVVSWSVLGSLSLGVQALWNRRSPSPSSSPSRNDQSRTASAKSHSDSPSPADVSARLADLSQLPDTNAANLLAVYEFAHANKLFCLTLITSPSTLDTKITATNKASASPLESPFSSYISLTSYLLVHAHLSTRTTAYAHLNLMVFRLLAEDSSLCSRIFYEDPSFHVPVRLCRQRPPYLPPVKGPRNLGMALFDMLADGITHNLRHRLDVQLYQLMLGILLRSTSHLSRSRTRIQSYHWADLFRALLSLVRFLTQYASGLRQNVEHIDVVVDHVINLLAFCLSAGETFLPTTAAYDDLFYKVVEAGDVLAKCNEAYSLQNRKSSSINTLLHVCAHYRQVLAGSKTKEAPASDDTGTVNGKSSAPSVSRLTTLTSVQVAEAIKQGYETLNIQTKEGLDSWEKYREADERGLLKRLAKMSVEDARSLFQEQQR